MTMQNLSRRDFFQSAAATGAALVGASAFGAYAPSKAIAAPVTDTELEDIEWESSADLVVLGSGCAGMYAAYKAAEAGLDVILLEKQPEETAGGDTRCMAANMPRQKITYENLVGTWSFGDIDEEWAAKIVEEIPNAVNWLLDHGCEWGGGMEDGMFEGNGAATYAALRDSLQETSVVVRYKTPAKSLIQNANGEVIGVIAESNGKSINVKAKRAVLVATGSYAANKQLLWDFHYPGIEMYSVGGPYLTGDGMIMAANIGAKLGKMSTGLEFDTVVSKAASEECGTGIRMNLPPNPSVIYVNQDGVRFQNEYLPMQHSKSTLPYVNFQGDPQDYNQGIAYYKNNVMWEVFDQAAFESGSVGNTGLFMTWAIQVPHDGYEWSADNSAELEKGWIIQADTIEELAEKMGVDAAALTKTVADYNDGCAAGEDAFERNPEQLIALGEGPYYAVELGIGILYNIGGLMTDANGRTLNWFNEPIPRLYSAGTVGMVGSYMGSLAARGNMAQGLIAVNDIQALDPWTEE